MERGRQYGADVHMEMRRAEIVAVGCHCETESVKTETERYA